MKQTIIAIALSAAFCYSSYALSFTVYEAQDALEVLTDVADTTAFCIEISEGEGDIVECINEVNAYAAQIIFEYAHALGQRACDCQDQDPAVFTF